MDFSEFRRDFPTLNGDRPLAYLDSACVSLKPYQVIEAINNYYRLYPACGGRSIHRHGIAVSRLVGQSRHQFSEWIGAQTPAEIVFTRNATHALNQVARGIAWEEGDIVLTGEKEHNSNLVPWQQMRAKHGIDHRIVPVNEDNTFDMESFEEMCSEAGDRLRLVSLTQTSNLDGVTNPIPEISKVVHDHDGLLCVDAAQSAPHRRIDVTETDADFMAFSLHKMLGPSGIGALWGKQEHLLELEPILGGGHTVSDTTHDTITFSKVPARFEGGLDNYSGILGAGAAIDYLSKVDFEALASHETQLNRYIDEGLRDLDGVTIIGPEDYRKRGGITSLLIDCLDVEDMGIMLDEAGDTLVRTGRMCTHSWFNARGITGDALRASVYLYNTEEEVKGFVDSFEEILQTMTA